MKHLDEQIGYKCTHHESRNKILNIMSSDVLRKKLSDIHECQYFALPEAVSQRCSVKKVFIEISQNSQENTCARVSFLIKLQASASNFIKKETLAQVFSCEFCKISKNTFSYRTPPVAAFTLPVDDIQILVILYKYPVYILWAKS